MQTHRQRAYLPESLLTLTANLSRKHCYLNLHRPLSTQDTKYMKQPRAIKYYLILHRKIRRTYRTKQLQQFMDYKKNKWQLALQARRKVANRRSSWQLMQLMYRPANRWEQPSNSWADALAKTLLSLRPAASSFLMTFSSPPPLMAQNKNYLYSPT